MKHAKVFTLLNTIKHNTSLPLTIPLVHLQVTGFGKCLSELSMATLPMLSCHCFMCVKDITDEPLLLKVFSREYSHKDYCLAHLFTDIKFEGGILGLAYVGSPRRNSVGGICTPGELFCSLVSK